MAVLATVKTWWPSTNPVGAWSITALVISAVVWFLVERRLPRSERIQGYLTIIAPLLLLVLVSSSKIHIDFLNLGVVYGWANWRYDPPDAQDYIADYIMLAVGLILAWKAARLPARDLRTLGVLELIAALGFLGLEARLLYDDLYAF